MTKVGYKKLVAVLFILFLSLGFNLVINTTSAYNFSQDSGLNTTADKAGFSQSLKTLTPETISGQIISIILFFLGVVFISLIIYGGMVWLTSEGNDQKITKAKGTLTMAFIGLSLVVAAYAISRFVIAYFSSTALKSS